MVKKVLVLTHELDPYVKLTSQSHFTRILSQQIHEKELETRVFMPRFGKINERKHRLHEVIRLSGINITVGDDDNPMIIKVASLPSAKLQVYFIDNEDLFHRKHYLTDKEGKFFRDNDDRMIFFNKGAIEILLKLGWLPDIIHCHGWMTSLFPMLAKLQYKNEPAFRNSKIIFTPFGSDFNDTLGTKFLGKANLNGKTGEVKDLIENPTCNDLYKLGIKFADAVSFGSLDVDDKIKEFAKNNSDQILDFIDPDDESFKERYFEFYTNLQ